MGVAVRVGTQFAKKALQSDFSDGLLDIPSQDKQEEPAPDLQLSPKTSRKRVALSTIDANVQEDGAGSVKPKRRKQVIRVQKLVGLPPPALELLARLF